MIVNHDNDLFSLVRPHDRERGLNINEKVFNFLARRGTKKTCLPLANGVPSGYVYTSQVLRNYNGDTRMRSRIPIGIHSYAVERIVIVFLN